VNPEGEKEKGGFAEKEGFKPRVKV